MHDRMPPRTTISRILIGLLATAALAAGGGPAAAAERAVLILDASGSMWGQLEGRAKIDIAREVVRDLMDRWSPEVELGLMAYGHRRKGDCDDIELLIPPGPGTGPAVLGAVDSLQPRGKTPITEALRQAAAALRAAEDRATVILVSDGEETCGGDPCAAAAELEATGVDLTVHVVGFDVSEPEQEQLRCIAEKTGGRFFPAADAAALAEALRAVAEEVEAVPPPEPAPASSGPAKLKVQAVLASGRPPLEKALSWKVFEAEADFEGNRKQVAWEIAPSQIFTLPPGRYLLTADYGNTHRETEVSLDPGEERVFTFDLQAGQVKVDAVLAAGKPRIDGDVSFKVFEAEPDFEGNRKQVAWELRPSHIFTLPAGRYLVTAEFGYARAEQEIEVEPGAQFARTLDLGAGQVKLTARRGAGGEPLAADVDWKVYRGEADFEGNRERIAWELTASPVLTLEAGDYVVVAGYGGLSAEKRFSLAPGEQKPIEVVFE